VQCAAYTGAKVDRYDWQTEEPYYLILSTEPDAVDLTRVAAKACPVLDNHSSWEGCDGVLGIVDEAQVQNGVVQASLRFSQDQNVDSIWGKIEEKILTSVSVGVKVLKLADVSGENDAIKTYMATKWMLMEVSVVPSPADMNAGFLSSVMERDTLVPSFVAATDQPSNSSERNIMEQHSVVTDPAQQQLAATTPVTAATSVEDVTKIKAELAESVRKAGIFELASKFEVAHLANDAIANNTTVEGFRMLVAEYLYNKSKDNGPRQTHVAMGQDDREKFRDSVVNALLHIDRPQAVKLDGGRAFMGMSMLEIARECLTRAGVNTRGMDRGAIAKLAFQSTSDFPYITENVANKSLRAGYDAFPQTFRPVARMVTISDFKALSMPLIGGQSALPKVKESGEVKYGKLFESKNSVQLATYAEIIPMTRQLILNDDKQAFTRVPFLMGAKAAQTESNVVWGIITANAAMADGVEIFHADHKNLVGTGTAIAVDSIGVMRALIRKQKDLDSTTVLNLTPQYLIAGTDLETLMAQIRTQITAAQFSNAIPDFIRSMTPIIEPRLDVTSGAKPWYMAADPNQADGLVYAYLEGQQGVYVETEMGFDVDGMKIKARLDLGAAMIDHRTWAKNPGV
jgi:hypothetical protein